MRAAAMRYWRAGERILVKEDHGDKALYYEVLKSSEVKKVVVEEFERTKGSGTGILAFPLRDNFLGELVGSMYSVLQELFNLAATVYLEHFAKNHGEHYMSLEQVTDNNNGSEEDYEANDPGEKVSEDYANKMHME
ncbi:hypothetical protein AWC38_SpisGene10965 [Stylophora pistillata]|uniref:Uncharacterized protein n=1 Tax=Stylophora pistillata TaxID=50429 RepID=A0A2B4S7A5_STYPI|nr:hypothetical protein AWC38_SpisGene10965 [Stylophora pistillata]